jgi:hypothetical protein
MFADVIRIDLEFSANSFRIGPQIILAAAPAKRAVVP